MSAHTAKWNVPPRMVIPYNQPIAQDKLLLRRLCSPAALEFRCDGCQRIGSPPRFKCTSCLNIDYCKECMKAAPLTHPAAHEFQRITLRTLLEAAQGRGDVFFDEESAAPLAKGCCPTCLDHRPDTFGSYVDGKGRERSESWMSDYTIHLSDLQESSERGCSICSIIFRGIELMAPGTIAENSKTQIVIQDDHFGISGSQGTGYMYSDMWRLYFRSAPGFTSPWATLRPHRQLSNNLGDTESFAQIDKWIGHCQLRHKNLECGKYEEGILPKRVLHVGGSNNDRMPYLLETHGTRGRYIALSYCWGKKEFIRTTSKNFAQMCQGIDPSTMPKTILDAVTCARRLGVEYVWIDALCIVQDDAHDWEVESAKMCDIYADAYLVIVAAAAEDTPHGFLNPRLPMYKGVPLESVEGSGVYDMEVRHTMPHKRTFVAHQASSMLDSCTESRAWCFQEALLARRCLSFHSGEMLWECGGQLVCECDGGNRGYLSTSSLLDGSHPFTSGPDGGIVVNSRQDNVRATDHQRPLIESEASQRLYNDWMERIVPVYTGRQLTKSLDRLPALSGLAAVIARRCQDHYIAGLWKNDLKVELLWQVKGHPGAALTSYHGPSFSWVSVGSQVEYEWPAEVNLRNGNTPYGNIGIDIINAHCDVPGVNPHGAVTGGSMTLKGLVQKASLCSDSRGCHFSISSHATLLEFFPDAFLRAVEVENQDQGQSHSILRVQERPRSAQEPTVEVICLIVADIPHSVISRFSKDWDTFAVLVLSRSKQHPGSYERVGIASIAFEPDVGREWVSEAERREITIL